MAPSLEEDPLDSEPQEPESDDIRDLRNVTAKVQELYTNYVLIARSQSGNFVYRSSDGVWAVGACQKYINYSEAKDWAEEMEST